MLLEDVLLRVLALFVETKEEAARFCSVAQAWKFACTRNGQLIVPLVELDLTRERFFKVLRRVSRQDIQILLLSGSTADLTRSLHLVNGVGSCMYMPSNLMVISEVENAEQACTDSKVVSFVAALMNLMSKLDVPPWDSQQLEVELNSVRGSEVDHIASFIRPGRSPPLKMNLQLTGASAHNCLMSLLLQSRAWAFHNQAETHIEVARG
mmetsp:Transcript_82555/g.157243  ORF Transcript_82555/g.157243 Transcript_82555/m.157243 type:complete len:209 (-) Transcript_82555:124-750(-)